MTEYEKMLFDICDLIVAYLLANKDRPSLRLKRAYNILEAIRETERICEITKKENS